MLAACALHYGQLEAVAGAAVGALRRNEHLASGLAELAEFCEAKYHDERLVRPQACILQRSYNSHEDPKALLMYGNGRGWDVIRATHLLNTSQACKAQPQGLTVSLICRQAFVCVPCREWR